MLCFSCQFTSYTTNLITSLFPTLALLYPTLQITDIWETPSNHPTKETITEVLAKSNLHLQSVKLFNPYDASHICPTPISDSNLPPHQKTKSRKYPGHNNPAPPSAPSYPVAGHSPPPSPPLPSTTTSQLCPHSQQQEQQLQTTPPKCSTNSKPRLLQFSLCLNPAPIPSQEVNIQEISAQLNQSIANLPALIQQQVQATLHSPYFSAAVTKSLHSEILSLQPPYSQTEESGSKDEGDLFRVLRLQPPKSPQDHRILSLHPPSPAHPLTLDRTTQESILTFLGAIHTLHHHHHT